MGRENIMISIFLGTCICISKYLCFQHQRGLGKRAALVRLICYSSPRCWREEMNGRRRGERERRGAVKLYRPTACIITPLFVSLTSLGTHTLLDTHFSSIFLFLSILLHFFEFQYRAHVGHSVCMQIDECQI